MLSCKEAILSIIRLGVGDTKQVTIPENIDWDSMEALANKQGLSAILVDGVERLPADRRPPKSVLLQWIGETLQGYEYRYELYRRAISELASFCNQHGYKMMILKGYACSLNWPNPAHRPCGDIDIWQFGRQKEADAILAREKGVKIDKSHHHHTVFEWRGFMVENHYDFVNVYAHSSSAKLEKVFKELGQDDTHYVELSGEKVYLPSPNLHALFLIRHMAAHFAAAEISLRQVLDWAFFLEKHANEVNWEWLMGLLDQYHMRDFFNCINAICVEDLGFDDRLFPKAQSPSDLKEKVLNDILDPSFGASEPLGLVPRLVYKYRRWQGNAWKQRLCYGESRWSAFWSGIWAKILKPASI